MQYRTNYLTNVIFRADFEGLLDLRNPDRPPLSRAIGEWFPHLTVRPSAQVSINVGPQGTEFRQQMAAPMYDHRRAEGSTPKVILAGDYLSLEYEGGFQSYRNVMRGEIEQVAGALGRAYPDLNITRIGLRYINQVSLPQGLATDWNGLIDASLIQSVSAGIPTDMRLARSIRQLQAFDDRSTLLLTHGWTNPDFPGELVRRHFVIDIDVFKHSPTVSHEVLQIADELNTRCELTFETSIGPGLREMMGIIHAH